MSLLAWFGYAAAIGLLMVGAAWLAAHIFANRRWPVRGIWSAALLILVVLPGTAPFRSEAPPSAPVSVFLPAEQAVFLEPPVASPPVLLREPPPAALVPRPTPTRSTEEWLIIGWAAFSGLLAFAVGLGYLGFRRRCSSWRIDEVDGRTVWIADDVGPAAVGVLKGRVVLPRWVLAASHEERALILAHEEEHLRAGDPRLLGIALLAALVFPWNPAVWIAWRALRRAVELDCDRRVLRRGFDPLRYGRLLIDVTERGTPHRFAVAAPSESPSFLERIISNKLSRPTSLLRPRVVAALVLAIAAVSTAFRLPHPTQEPEARTGFALGPTGATHPSAALEEDPVVPAVQVRDFGPSTPENEGRVMREMVRAVLEREHPEVLQGAPGGQPVTLYVLIDGNGDLVRSAAMPEPRGRNCMRSIGTVLGIDMLPSDYDFVSCGSAAAGEATAGAISYQLAALKPESEQQRIAPTGPYPLSHLFHRGRPARETLTELIRQHHPEVYQTGLPEGETLWAVGNDANQIVRSGRHWGWAGKGAARDAIRQLVPDLRIGDVQLTSVPSASGQRIPVAWMRILPPQMSIENEGREPYPAARSIGVSTAEPGRIVEFHLSGPGADDLGRFRFSHGTQIIDGVLTATTPFTFTVLDDQPFQAELRLRGEGRMTIETESTDGVRVRIQLAALHLRRGNAGDEIMMVRGENARPLLVRPGIPNVAVVEP